MTIQKQLSEARILLKEVFEEATWRSDEKYDHKYVTEYQNAQKYLVSCGLLKNEDCVRVCLDVWGNE